MELLAITIVKAAAWLGILICLVWDGRERHKKASD